MFKDVPTHPITKEPILKSEKLSCTVEKKYGTGIVLCKEKKNYAGLIVASVITIVIMLSCVFAFAVQVEFHHLDEIPVVSFIVMNPVTIIIAVIVVAIIIIAASKR